MFKLKRFYKPYWLWIVLSIVLLFAQAQADLTLPDYMSDIVNIGIQQNGLEHAMPELLTEEDYNRLLRSLDSSTREALAKLYQRTSAVDQTLAGQKIERTSDSVYQLIAGSSWRAVQPAVEEALVRQFLSDVPSELFNQKHQLAIKAKTEIYRSYGVDIAAMQRGYILKVGAFMIAISLLAALCLISVVLLASRIAAGIGRDLRGAVFRKIEQFHSAEFDRFSSASLITRTTNDVMQIQTLMVILIRIIFYAPLLAIGGIIHALNKSVSMSWTIALAVIVLIGLIGLILFIVMPRFKRMQKLVDKLNLLVRETLSGLMVIRAFNNEAHHIEKFEDTNTAHTNNNLFINRLIVIIPTVMTLIMNLTMLLIVWTGAEQIAMSAIQVGDMMAFMQYAMQIIMSFLMMSMMFMLLPRASVSAERIDEILSSPASILEKENPQPLHSSFQGKVEFDQVSFKYPSADQPALSDISFTAQPGKTTAIIGPTGSGKTTLINLILRFYDPSAGVIKLDDQNIADLSFEELRAVLGYVPQKSRLFSGDIASNMKVADKNASDETIIKALEVAQASEFIFNDQSAGLTRQVSQGGNNFSGGQKQRLAIARALIRKPKVLLFDDSFSALDFTTENALRKSLANWSKATIIIVAQRIASVKNADQILVLDEGRLVGKGSHHELLNACQTYREIAYSQLSEEELS